MGDILHASPEQTKPRCLATSGPVSTRSSATSISEAVSDAAVEGPAAEAASGDLVLVGDIAVDSEVGHQHAGDTAADLDRGAVLSGVEIDSTNIDGVVVVGEALQKVRLHIGSDEAAVVGLERPHHTATGADDALIERAEVGPDAVDVGRAVEHQVLPRDLDLRLDQKLLPAEADRIAAFQRGADHAAGERRGLATRGGTDGAVEPAAGHDAVEIPAHARLEGGDAGDLADIDVAFAEAVGRIGIELQLAVGTREAETQHAQVVVRDDGAAAQLERGIALARVDAVVSKAAVGLVGHGVAVAAGEELGRLRQPLGLRIADL